MFHDDERGEARSLVDWRHVTRLAPRTRLLIDAANVSDPDYFEDFGVGFEGTSVTFVEPLRRPAPRHRPVVARPRARRITR